MGLIREFQRAAANGVSAHDFVNATNFFEIARQRPNMHACRFRRCKSHWAIGGNVTRPGKSNASFKRSLAAGVALVAGPDEPRRDMADDVLQESFWPA